MPDICIEIAILRALVVAEYYRDMGKNVTLHADSIRNWSDAAKEVSIKLDEPVKENGLTTKFEDSLKDFYERA